MHKFIRLVMQAMSLSLVVACADQTDYIVVRHGTQTAAASSGDEKEQVIDPWVAEEAANVVVPPIEDGPAKIVGNILMLNTAYVQQMPGAHYEVRGDIDGMPNVRWSSGPAIDDSDGDGWLEFDLVAAKPGVYALTFMSSSRRKGDESQRAEDTLEMWANFGSAQRSQISAAGKRFLHCTNEEYYKKCAVRIAVDAKRVITPAADAQTSRALALEAAAVEAKAKALAAKIAAETPPQELGIVEEPVQSAQSAEVLETPADTESPNMSFTLEETVISPEESVTPEPVTTKKVKKKNRLKR